MKKCKTLSTVIIGLFFLSHLNINAQKITLEGHISSWCDSPYNYLDVDINVKRGENTYSYSPDLERNYSVRCRTGDTVEFVLHRGMNTPPKKKRILIDSYKSGVITKDIVFCDDNTEKIKQYKEKQAKRGIRMTIKLISLILLIISAIVGVIYKNTK